MKKYNFIDDKVAPNLKTPIVDENGERMSIGKVLDALNSLSEEIECCKEDNDTIEIWNKLVSFADNLIYCMGDDAMKEIWDIYSSEKYHEYLKRMCLE